uniref:Uncharacterized protein n=1 Tax=Oryzias latipes TaxID=8090 RepID=A0A3P9IG24_ORYLA
TAVHGLHEILSTFIHLSKLPPSNITKKEMAAIHNLKNNRKIIILPADKGRTTVILDTEQYEKQMNEMLQDRNTYEVLKRDHTEAKKKKHKTILKQLQEEKNIDKQTYNHLIPTATPLRPIIDSMGSYLEGFLCGLSSHTFNPQLYLRSVMKPSPSIYSISYLFTFKSNKKIHKHMKHDD